MRYFKYLITSVLCLALSQMSYAHINKLDQGAPASTSNTASLRMDCDQATAQVDMEINNIRARLLVGGDVWWDGDNGLYVVPKPPEGSDIPPVSSLFAGAVWLGGFDPGGNLKMAAQTYGTSSGASDFWPGPLTTIGTVGTDTCAQWDKFFKVSGDNIRAHLRLWQEAVDNMTFEIDPQNIPDDILGWPAVGNQFFFSIHGFALPSRPDQGYAPFFDENDNGEYEPNLGDYPIIEIRGCEEFAPQFGDEMIFWIYNDAGNIHTQTGGDAIQMEVQVQAFGYATNDEINDMTFYRYKLINWAIESIDSAYFAMWIDPDLGCFTDDYVGCDTALSLMYVYNSDALDGESSCSDCSGVNTYCTDIPILGVDYFRGPLGPKVFINGMDDSDGLRNPDFGEAGDTIIELGMTAFTYYNNPSTDPTPPPGTTDPTTGNPQQFYNYISGSWQDGTRFTYGGDGYDPTSTDFINYAFTEAPNDPNGWSMAQEQLPDGDRRTIQASGPFRLDPRAKNELIIGVVWVPDEDYPSPSIARLTRADETAQALFDNCFDLLDGPDAPDVCFVELDQEIIITLSNEESSNNFNQEYAEVDPFAPPGLPDEEKTYFFEGYQVYQLISPNVESFENPDEARLIYQVDVKNGVSTLYNWEADETAAQIPGQEVVYVPVEKVDGADSGIRTTFSVTEDQFGLTDSRLVNHKKYYFSVVAYGYNEWEPFDNTPPGTGQDRPYVSGRGNIGPEDGVNGYTVIPRPIVDRELQSDYGDGAIVTRLDGIGAGGNFLDISDETRTNILDGNFDGSITYKGGRAPIDVKVYNPLDAVDGVFELEFIDEDMTNNVLDDELRWLLTKEDDSSVEVISARTLDELNEQAIADFGFSITVGQTADVGEDAAANNGALGFELEYADINSPEWLGNIPAATLPFNYLSNSATMSLDESGDLSALASGYFYPYRLLNVDLINPLISPAWMAGGNNTANTQNRIELINNVDIVFTSNKDLWSRCVVIETSNSFFYGSNGLGVPTEGDALTFDLRQAPSVGKGGTDLPEADGDGVGMGWFPGYAIDVETGKRLNIFFGENSVFDCESVPALCDDGTLSREQLTGRDMMFNPTSDAVFANLLAQPLFPFQFVGGGHHFVYVSDTEYDECATIRTQLTPTTPPNPLLKVGAVSKIRWAGFPLLQEGVSLLSYGDGLIPNETTIKLRVDNPYKEAIGTGENDGVNKYMFRFDGVEADLADEPDEVETQLDAINVVPNPYYGFSSYETSEFSNTVKITNLPAKCTVTIFTLDGKFVRQYVRNEDRETKDLEYGTLLRDQITPAIEWDLENTKGIPVASGVYLIHIDADGLGERVIKWFGVARQFDPSGL